MQLIDAHVHLQIPPLLDHAEAVLGRAAAAGVGAMVVNSTKPQDWAAVARLAEQCCEARAGIPQLIPCFGVHPWEVAACTKGWEEELERRLDSIPCAVGEVGLDRWIEPRDEVLQERVFRYQLSLARRRKRPVMVHCLRAWDWLQRVLAEEAPLPAGFLLHAYGGSPGMIPLLVKQGAYFSFAGTTFEAKRAKLRDSLAAVPADRLLLETDAPAMLPPREMQPDSLIGAEGRPVNEPSNLRIVYKAAANLRAVSVNQLTLELWRNAKCFLGDLLK